MEPHKPLLNMIGKCNSQTLRRSMDSMSCQCFSSNSGFNGILEEFSNCMLRPEPSEMCNLAINGGDRSHSTNVSLERVRTKVHAGRGISKNVPDDSVRNEQTQNGKQNLHDRKIERLLALKHNAVVEKNRVNPPLQEFRRFYRPLQDTKASQIVRDNPLKKLGIVKESKEKNESSKLETEKMDGNTTKKEEKKVDVSARKIDNVKNRQYFYNLFWRPRSRIWKRKHDNRKKLESKSSPALISSEMPSQMKKESETSEKLSEIKSTNVIVASRPKSNYVDLCNLASEESRTKEENNNAKKIESGSKSQNDETGSNLAKVEISPQHQENAPQFPQENAHEKVDAVFAKMQKLKNCIGLDPTVKETNGEAVQERRRRQLMEYVGMVGSVKDDLHGLKRFSFEDPQSFMGYKKLSKQKTIKSIYEDFFPRAGSPDPVASWRLPLPPNSEKLELRGRINETRRRLELQKSVFGDTGLEQLMRLRPPKLNSKLQQMKQRSTLSLMTAPGQQKPNFPPDLASKSEFDLKGSLKYLLNFKSRLMEKSVQ